MKRALLASAACGVALALLLAVEPLPMTEHGLAERLGEDAECAGPEVGSTLPARRVRVAVAATGAQVLARDDARGESLVATRYCNHSLRPPAFWVEGDLPARGAVLLRPVGDDLRVDAAPPGAEPQYGPPGSVPTAVAGLRASSPWPPFLAYAALLAGALGGLGLASTRAAALAPVLAVAAGAQLREGWFLLAGILTLPLVPVGLALGVAAAWSLARRRAPRPGLVAAFLAIAGFLAAAWLAHAYFPMGGAGD